MLLPLEFRGSRAGRGYLGVVQVGGRCCYTLASALEAAAAQPPPPRLVPWASS